MVLIRCLSHSREGISKPVEVFLPIHIQVQVRISDFDTVRIYQVA